MPSPLRTLLQSQRGALVMGIVNRTPDSFSDGGRFVEDEHALAHVERLVREGAHLVDIGAESTRPGAPSVDADEQKRRLGNIVRKSADLGVIVSVDTTSPEVAAWALDEGASVINSVSLEPARELGALAARSGAALVLMHCRGSMTSMRGFSDYADDAYGDVVKDVASEWRIAAEEALASGLSPDELLFDPGLGFTKNARQSVELCARLDELCDLGYPVLVGPSRKSFLAKIAAKEGEALAPPEQRLGGTIAAVLGCVAKGALVVRVHDVAVIVQALAVARALSLSKRREAA